MTSRQLNHINNELIEKLEAELLSFQNMRKETNNQKDLAKPFCSLSAAFFKLIDARNQAIIESVSKEEYERLIKGVDNNVQIVLNWRVEELIKTVSSEITDYAKKANY